MHRKTIRSVLAASAVIAIGVPSAAIGFGEGKRLRLGERNPSHNASRALSSETEIIADTGTYGTRQSNKRLGDGGGAIYGCRSDAGREPCIRANNLRGGRAFEFATAGKEGGRIDLADPSGAPLTTNATGVATGLNADRLDGRNGEDFAAAGALKSASVSEAGKLERGRGATEAKLLDPAKGTYTVTFDSEVKDCSFTASPRGQSYPEALGVAAADDPKTVLVDQQDAAEPAPTEEPEPPARTAFDLQVIC